MEISQLKAIIIINIIITRKLTTHNQIPKE